MEDWPSYANITVPNSCNMDQVTQQATLLSARIGIEVAPISLYKYEDWLDSFKVGALPRLDPVLHADAHPRQDCMSAQPCSCPQWRAASSCRSAIAIPAF